MTQQSHSQAYTLRKPKLKETHVSHCSLQHYLQLARTWKQPRCPLIDEWIKLWYIYTMEYYSAIKRNTFESVLMRWMNLEPIIQSEVSQKEKDKYCILMHIYHFPGGSDSKASVYNVGYPGSIPGLGRSPGEGNGSPLQHSCLENPWTEEPDRLQSMGSQRVRHD